MVLSNKTIKLNVCLTILWDQVLKDYTIIAKLCLKTEYTHKTQSSKHILVSLTLAYLYSALLQMHWFDEKLNINWL